MRFSILSPSPWERAGVRCPFLSPSPCGEGRGEGSTNAYMRPNKLTISIADLAASEPLLPAFVPALSIACSMLSVVRTPNITGISVSKPTDATPFETSAQT